MSLYTAVVFLADGEECRCLKVPEEGTVGDLIEHMLQVQRDWEELGSSDTDTDTTGPTSDAEVPRECYGIVEVTIPEGGGVARERFLEESMALAAEELTDARRSWDRTMFRHLRAQFAHAGRVGPSKKGKRVKKGKDDLAKGVGATGGGTVTAKITINNRIKKATRQEFWFVSPTSQGGATSGDVRLKFVNRNEYKVVREKEGWLDVKEKGKKRSRWVVYQEDTLRYFKDPADAVPTFALPNVSDCELDIKKGKKEQMTIKLRKDKIKTQLLCENEVMADKWYTAITQGKSGAIEQPKIKLKEGIVEPIPEYTEEEEMRDIANAISLKKLALQSDDGGYLSIEALRKAENGSGEEDDYMTLDDCMDVMMNEDGDYLTVEAMQALIDEAGYLTIDEVNALAKEDGGYLDVQTLRDLARDAGYLTTEEMQELMEFHGDGDDDFDDDYLEPE